MHEARVSENSVPERLPLKDAAALLGITAGAVRARLRRGTLQCEKDGDGQLWILVERTPREEETPEAAAVTDEEDQAEQAAYSAAPAPPCLTEPPVAAAPPEPVTAAPPPPPTDADGRLFDMQEVYQQAFTMVQSERERANAIYAAGLELTGENARLLAERDALRARVRELEAIVKVRDAERKPRYTLDLEEISVFSARLRLLIDKVDQLAARPPRQWWKR